MQAQIDIAHTKIPAVKKDRTSLLRAVKVLRVLD